MFWRYPGIPSNLSNDSEAHFKHFSVPANFAFWTSWYPFSQTSWTLWHSLTFLQFLLLKRKLFWGFWGTLGHNLRINHLNPQTLGVLLNFDFIPSSYPSTRARSCQQLVAFNVIFVGLPSWRAWAIESEPWYFSPEIEANINLSHF